MNVWTEVFKQETEQSPLSAVVLVHGAGDHSGRYQHVINELNQAGFAVVTGDLPGHGKSEGLRGHVDSFDEYLDAVEGWVREAERLAGDGTVALIGHSMGGLVTVRFLQERGARHKKIVRAVLSSPCLQLQLEVPSWKKGLASVLDRIAPKLRMPSGIDPSMVSRSPEVVEKYRVDPLCGFPVSVRWYRELDKAMAAARTRPQEIGIPVLVMQAGADQLVVPQVSEQFQRGLPSAQDVPYVLYPDLYHELFNEPERDEVLRAVVQFLQEPLFS